MPALVADVEGHGPAVVLLHGQPGRAGNWHRVTALLNGRYTTIAPDRLGYGRTGGPSGDFVANAAATVALLDSLGVERAVVVGHSWAGAVALQLAVSAAERISGLVLVASVAPGDPIGRLDRMLATRPLGEVAARATLGIAGRALAVPSLRRAVSRALPSGPAELVADARPSRNSWRSFAAEQRVYVEHIDDLADDLAGITAPTRVVVGTSDRVVHPEAGALLAGRIPGAVLLTVPRAGHLLPWDHPESVEQAVDAVAAAG
jgi:pimeloyl-ACP methyl ester carboxylesterase